MDIWDQARDLAKRGGWHFEDMYRAYLSAGYVFKTPDSMIWMEPIYGMPYKGEKIDAWFIFLAIGEGAASFWSKSLPFELPYIAYVRADDDGKDLKIMSTDRYRKLRGIK
jgi:hypothetical protein